MLQEYQSLQVLKDDYGKGTSMLRTEIKEMRALSIMQPWAYTILHEGKNIENRPRITHYRGTIAVHASQSMYQEDFDSLAKHHGIKLDPYSDKIAAMSVIGFVDIVDVVTKKSLTRSTRTWFQGEYGYVLQNPVSLKSPVEIKGALGFWRLTGKSLKDCLRQLSDKQLSGFVPFEKDTQ